jgi:hypothetical protein
VAAVRRAITSRTAALFDIVLQRAGMDPADVGGTEPLAYALVGAGESLANWWLDHPEEPIQAMAQRLLDVAWTGLKAVLQEKTRANVNPDLQPNQPRSPAGYGSRPPHTRKAVNPARPASRALRDSR